MLWLCRESKAGMGLDVVAMHYAETRERDWVNGRAALLSIALVKQTRVFELQLKIATDRNGPCESEQRMQPPDHQSKCCLDLVASDPALTIGSPVGSVGMLSCHGLVCTYPRAHADDADAVHEPRRLAARCGASTAVFLRHICSQKTWMFLLRANRHTYAVQPHSYTRK